MQRPWRIALVATTLIVVAHLLDPWAWRHVIDPEIYEHDLGRMLRVIGYYPLWVLLGLALWLSTRNRRPALQLALIPGLGGLAAEVFKLLLRRERPRPHDGEYFFRALDERTFSTSGLALPSSHALVAFTGAWVLCRLFPKGWPVWLFLAIGCGLSRVQAQAHFLSDVTVAAIAGWLLVQSFDIEEQGSGSHQSSSLTAPG